MKRIVMSLAVFCLLAACISDESSAPEVEVKDGALHFRDAAVFSSIISSLHAGGPQELQAFEERLGFHDSLRRAASARGEAEVSLVNIKDDAFATLVNSRGVFYVAGTIHKIGADYEYALEGGTEEELSHLLSAGGASAAASRLSVHRIGGRDSKQAISANAFSGIDSVIDAIGTDPSGNAKRVVKEAWSRNYLLYASNGVNLTTQSYRRTCGLCSKKWRDSAVSYLKVAVHSRQYSSITGSGMWFELNKQEEVYSYHHIQKVMDYVAGTGVWIDTDYIDCTYTYVPDDGVRHDDFIHWGS